MLLGAWRQLTLLPLTLQRLHDSVDCGTQKGIECRFPLVEVVLTLNDFLNPAVAPILVLLEVGDEAAARYSGEPTGSNRLNRTTEQ